MGGGLEQRVTLSGMDLRPVAVMRRLDCSIARLTG